MVIIDVIRVVIIDDPEFQRDLLFELVSRLFIARRYGQNMVYPKDPRHLLNSQYVVIE